MYLQYHFFHSIICLYTWKYAAAFDISCWTSLTCLWSHLWVCSIQKMLYLEAEDDGPDESERESVVSVHDIMWPHVLQMHALLLEELQGLVHVLQAVDSHAALRRLGLCRDQNTCAWIILLHNMHACSFHNASVSEGLTGIFIACRKE